MRRAAGIPELASFGDTLNVTPSPARAGGGARVPLVSISTASPAPVRAGTSPASCRAWSSGSPPVITTSPAGWPTAQAVTSATGMRRCSALRSKRVQSQV